MFKIRNIIYTAGCSIVLVMVYASSCEKLLMERVYRIQIENYSPNTVNFIVGNHFSFPVYPDTSLRATRPGLQAVPPSDKRWHDSWIPWEDVYKEFPADTMSIFFIDNSVYEQTDWEEVRNEYKILMRYDLSIKDLQQLNFVVPYPPTSAMRNMKIFQPLDVNVNQ